MDAGLFEEANELLESSSAVGNVPHLRCFFAAHLLARVYLCLESGNSAEARILVNRALQAARENGGASYVGWLQPSVVQRVFTFALDEPLEVEYVGELIERYHVAPPAIPPDNWPWPLRIFTLGRFALLVGAKPVAASRKAPKKLFALLKYLAAENGRPVSENTLSEVFWPEQEGDEARERLKIAIHRLRRLLGDPSLLRVQGGQLALDASRVWVDSWALEQHVARGNLDIAESAEEKARLLMNLYQGDFLAEDEVQPWLLRARERIRTLVIGALGRFAKACRAAGNLEQAMALYNRAIEIDHLAESDVQGTDALLRGGQPARGRGIGLPAARKTLSIVLSTKPSSESRALVARLLDSAR